MPDPQSPPSEQQGTQVLAGRYRLVRPIASGGMAQVWEAEDAVLGRAVAVKLLHPHLASDAMFVARFRAEAISAARLTHPGIVSIYDTWSGDGTEAIVMELVRGTTLRHLLDARGALPPSEAVTIADHIAAALDAAHRAGIVHRDIKPANVLLSADGRVLVTDFGIAKAVEGSDLTAEHTMLGTAKYLAPEQVEGAAVDGRADIYALGVVLYEMLTGQAPFQADTEAATALARLHRYPDPPSAHRPGLSPGLETLVLQSMARPPAQRPPTAADLRRLLGTVDTTLAPGAAVPSAPAGLVPGPPAAPPTAGPDLPADAPAEPRRSRAGRRVVIGLVVVALVVAAILAFGLRGTVGDPKPLAITAGAAFDPLGHPPGEENNASAGLAVDGDPQTAWSTEKYRDPANLGKPGVGYLVRLDRTARLAELVVESPSPGWSASIYVATGEPGATLESWGQPVATRGGLAPGRQHIALGGHRADAVLIWITRTGDAGVVQLTEVSVTGR